MNNLRIDSHKLIFHPKKVAQWLEGDMIYPILVEVGLSGSCNHRCIFCCVDDVKNKPIMLDADILLDNLKLMYKMGLKSINFAGNGEPLLNKKASYIINSAKQIGLDIGLTTNGVLFNKNVAQDCMKSLIWVRFSVSGVNDETYNKIHQSKDKDLNTVFSNIADAVEIKRKNSLSTTLGLQIILIPENINEVYELGKKAKELGVDYYTVKPYGIRPLSTDKLKGKFDISTFYNDISDIEEKLNLLNSENFKVYVRINRMNKQIEKKPYDTCHALPFFSFIDALGNVWPCCSLMGYDNMLFGNLYENDFIKIWEGAQRNDAIRFLHKTGISLCSEGCRLDEMNRYLEELKSPNLHVNFI